MSSSVSSHELKNVLWTAEPSAWRFEYTIVQVQATEANQHVSCWLQTEFYIKVAQDRICRMPCFESQGKYYNRPYYPLVCRWSTLKAMPHKVIHSQSLISTCKKNKENTD